MMKMKFETAKEWYAACAAMVREGCTFEAYKWDGNWYIEFTGGF